jgi:hypothetical protein
MSIIGPRSALATFIALPFIAAALLAGCATTVQETPAPSLTCEQLAVEIAGTRVARAQALEKRHDPLTLVVPFAFAAASSVGEADSVLAELNARAREKGCTLLA